MTEAPPEEGTSAWAEAKAKECWASMSRSFVSSYGSRSRAQARSSSIGNMRDEALRYEALAKELKAEGK